MPTIAAAALARFAESLLLAAGASGEESRVVSRSLVDANLKGYDSHGVMRLPYYVEAMKTGEAVTGAELELSGSFDDLVDRRSATGTELAAATDEQRARWIAIFEHQVAPFRHGDEVRATSRACLLTATR